MSSSVPINFRVSGSNVQEYMDRINQRANEMSAKFITDARAQTDVAKEQLKIYQQQIVELQRKFATEQRLAEISAQQNRANRLESHDTGIRQRYEEIDQQFQRGDLSNKQRRQAIERVQYDDEQGRSEIEEQYRQEQASAREQRRDNAQLLRTMRDNVDAIRTTSQAELNQMRRGDESLIDAVREDDDPSRRLANQLSTQQYIEEQAGRREDKPKEESTFGALLKALAVDKIGGMVASIPGAKNELDYIKPMLATTGMLVGGLLGNAIDAANVKILGNGLGNTNFGALGTQLGEKAGEFFGEAYSRTYKSRDELTIANFRTQALTGINLGVNNIGGANGLGGTGMAAVTADLKDYGADFKETAELQYKLAVAQANGRNLAGGAENILALQQGLGISQDTFLGLTELLRSSREENRDVIKLIGGVASAGKGNIFAQDRTFLGEFMQKNFSNLQRTLLTTQNEIASGTTFDILKRFDAIGGPFSARDTRSSGLINTIQGSLANPGSDNLKALSFIALRQNNPQMSLSSLLEEQQKGLASPTYLKTMLGMVDRLGGDESMKIMNTAQMLGLGNNIGAARKLYENRDKLMNGQISTAELMGTGEYSQESIRGLGKQQTSVYSVSTAEIENAFIEGATKGIQTVSKKMFQLFGDMIDEVQKYVDQKIKGSFKTETSPRQNAVWEARGAFDANGKAQIDRSKPIGGY